MGQEETIVMSNTFVKREIQKTIHQRKMQQRQSNICSGRKPDGNWLSRMHLLEEESQYKPEHFLGLFNNLWVLCQGPEVNFYEKGLRTGSSLSCGTGQDNTREDHDPIRSRLNFHRGWYCPEGLIIILIFPVVNFQIGIRSRSVP